MLTHQNIKMTPHEFIADDVGHEANFQREMIAQQLKKFINFLKIDKDS